MKRIELKTDGQFKTSEIIKITMSTDSQRGMNFAEMRQRNKILDKLEGADKALELEDAEYALLKGVVGEFRFAIANKSLENILSDILEA